MWAGKVWIRMEGPTRTNWAVFCQESSTDPVGDCLRLVFKWFLGLFKHRLFFLPQEVTTTGNRFLKYSYLVSYLPVEFLLCT